MSLRPCAHRGGGTQPPAAAPGSCAGGDAADDVDVVPDLCGSGTHCLSGTFTVTTVTPDPSGSAETDAFVDLARCVVRSWSRSR